MLNRFLSSDVGRELLARSTGLRLDMHRTRDGRIYATYELSGCVGNDPFGDCADDDDDEADDVLDAIKANERDAKRKAKDARDMMFVVDLMRQFEKVER